MDDRRRGILHAEMFPLLDRDGPNTLELFQIWLNLPAADKMVEPHFSMLWDHDIPRHRRDATPTAARVEITVIAGELGGAVAAAAAAGTRGRRGPSPIWRSGTSCSTRARRGRCPPADGRRHRRGSSTCSRATGITVDGEAVAASTGAVVDASRPISVARRRRRHAEVLVLQARPLGEPVAQYGPFVMNTRAEIQQAFADYQRTQFGGWPWDRDDPVHGVDGARFARHADGRVEHAA